MDKKDIRKEISAIKQNLSFEDKLKKSEEIIQKLCKHPKFIEADTVLMYYSLPDEVYTHGLIRKYCNKKRIILPVVCGEDLELKLYNETTLKTGAFGIKEPQGDIFDKYSEISLAVIPGVAFDSYGNRIGRGKGYYDRLLKAMNKYDIYKIGICFGFQRKEQIPAEAHDIKMDEIICSEE